jgi:hypothetical protein
MSSSYWDSLPPYCLEFLQNVYQFFANCIQYICHCFRGSDEAARPEFDDQRLRQRLPEVEGPSHSVVIPARHWAHIRELFNNAPDFLREKILVDDAVQTIHFSFDQITLLALATKYQLFKRLFGTVGRLPGLPEPTVSYVKKDRLVQEARQHLNRAAPAPNLQGINTQSHTELLTGLLTQNDGVHILEWHKDSSSKYVPMLSLQRLKDEKGLRYIGLEGYCSETLQQYLDEYTLGDDAEMHPVLEAYVDYVVAKQASERAKLGVPPGNYYTDKDLIIAAKRARLQVVALDTEASIQAQTTPEERLLAHNYMATRFIRGYPPGKWLLVSGAAHGPTVLGVPGVAAQMGFPTVLIKDRASSDPRGIVPNYRLAHHMESGDELQIPVNFAVFMDAPKKS